MKFKMGAAEIKAARKQPGGSNVGKKTFASGKPRTGPYVGPSGGSPKESYPIPDKAHAKAAIKMSGHAPNPAGIKSAVYRKYPDLKPEDKKQDGSKGVKSFPDLNKDGKITKADILKGRGVIKKTGAKSMKTDEKMCGSKGMKYAEGTKSIKFKKKPMMKRANGSTSQKGLWDNLRSKAAENKKTGAKPKAPTKEMLKQEKKIKFGK